MNPTATVSIARRTIVMLMFAALLLAVAAGLWLAERRGSPTPVSQFSGALTKTTGTVAPDHNKPKPKPCDDTKRRKCCDDDHKKKDDDCRPPSGKPK
jgi:hypothetical protein